MSNSNLNAVFARYLVSGFEGMTPGELSEARAMLRSGIDIRAAQGVGTGSAGGYAVPQEFAAKLDAAAKMFSAIRGLATIVQTATGRDLPYPTANDTGNTGALLTENSTAATADVPFGQILLKGYLYSSKIVQLSQQLAQDAFPEFENALAMMLGERLGRAENVHFTTGTGTGQPTGIVSAAPVGRTAATGQTTSITTVDELIELIHSVDPSYRRNASWMMNDASLKVIRKLKDSAGALIVQPGRDGAPESLLGYPIAINQDMPTMAANAKPIAFGDFSRYLIRIGAPQIMRLGERYADALQIGFHAIERIDGNLANASAGPVKVLQNSAT